MVIGRFHQKQSSDILKQQVTAPDCSKVVSVVVLLSVLLKIKLYLTSLI